MRIGDDSLSEAFVPIDLKSKRMRRMRGGKLYDPSRVRVGFWMHDDNGKSDKAAITTIPSLPQSTTNDPSSLLSCLSSDG